MPYIVVTGLKHPPTKALKNKVLIPGVNHFYIAGIQITLRDPTAGQHAGSRDQFRSRVNQWKLSNAENPTIRYIWISPKEANTTTIPATAQLPQTEEIFIKFSSVDARLKFLDA